MLRAELSVQIDADGNTFDLADTGGELAQLFVQLGIVFALRQLLNAVGQSDKGSTLQIIPHGHKAVTQKLHTGGIKLDLRNAVEVGLGAAAIGGQAAKLGNVVQDGHYLKEHLRELGILQHIRKDGLAVGNDLGIGGKELRQKAVLQIQNIAELDLVDDVTAYIDPILAHTGAVQGLLVGVYKADFQFFHCILHSRRYGRHGFYFRGRGYGLPSRITVW